MPILYESTDRMVRCYGAKMRKLAPGFDLLTFIAGVATGFFILPIVLPIVGYQVQKRWGPPAK